MDSRTSKLVSIVIPVQGREKCLEKCLESIWESGEKNLEVIVVASGGLRLKERRGLKVMKTEDIGPPGKRNLGVKESRGKYVLFLDSDVVVDKWFLKKVLKYMEDNSKVGAGQLKILRTDKRKFYDSAGEKMTGFGFLSERARGAEDQGQFDETEDIFSGKTAAMIVRRDVFDKAGGFDGDFFMYWEEPDLCWRIWKTGYRVVFLPMGRVWHAYNDRKILVEKKIEKITYLGCRNQLMTVVKNAVGWDLAGKLIVISGSWLGLSVLFCLKGRRGRARSVLKAFIWLLRNMTLVFKKREENKEKLGKRFFSDKKWMGRVRIKRGWDWYLGKGISYVLNRPF